MSDTSRRRFAGTLAALSAAAIGALGLSASPVRAASHSDAPLIKLDPQANITDVYAFVGAGASGNVLNVIVHVRPFSEPGDGVMYEKFSDDALYSIHITHPTTGETLRRYDFRFSGPSEGLKFQDTILSYGRGTGVGAITNNTAASRNYTQTYQVLRTNGGGSPTVIGSNLITPPPNVGLRTTPNYNDPTTGFAVSGATTAAGLDNYTRDALQTLSTGERVFCGPREDGFYADTPGIFDFLDPRIVAPSPPGTFGQAGGGVDGFKGYNVLAFAIQIPVSDLPTNTYTPVFAGAFGMSAAPATGVGVYASVSRPRITLRSSTGAPTSSGPFIQVNRMGNPLFNEVLVALRDKDNYNRTSPPGDAAFATYAENPEVAFLINAVLLASPNPGTGPLVTTGRADLRAVYIPDVLRVDTTTPPVRLAGAAGFNRLGFIGGDVTGGANPRSSGWPNGRRLGDDVVDIALTAVASGPTYSSVTLVGDNIETNDIPYHQVFPYSGTPHAGPKNRKDSP
jgi:hypothetical protein